MGDSTDNTNELDSYGVWVKRPPQDCAADTDCAQSDPAESDTASETPADSADALPVFDGSSFDVPAELAAAEQPAGSVPADLGGFQIEDFMTDASSASGGADGEISLDDFLGGASDSPSFGSDSGEISLDDFLDGGSFSSGGEEKEDDVPDDEPLDIEISFDVAEEDAVPTEPVADEDEDEYAEAAEESEFDDMFDPVAENARKPSDPEADGAALRQLMGNTEDISLDDFGLDESDDATAAAAAASVNAAAASKDTESVDLSDFGIDSDAGETPVTSNVKESARKRVVDYDLAITEDDMVQAAPVADEIKSEEKSEQEQHTENTTVSNKLLEQIIEDLSGLKNEINALKNDFAQLKANGASIPACPEPQDAGAPEEPVDFFDGAGTDADTALSGDEMDNIMSTAALTEETPDADVPAEPADTISADAFAEQQSAGEPDAAPEEPEEEIAVAEHEETEIPDIVADDELFEPLAEADSIAEDAEIEAPEAGFGDDEATFDSMEDNSEIAESEEEPDSGLKIDFDNEILEEPDLHDLEMDSDDMQDIPDEISVPKTEAAADQEAESDLLPADDILENTAEAEAAITAETAGEADEPAEGDLLPADDILEDTVETEADAAPEEADAEDEMFIEPQISAEPQDAGMDEAPDAIAAELGNEAEEPDFEAPDVPEDALSEVTTVEDVEEVMEENLDELMGEEPDVAEEISDESLDYLNEEPPAESDILENTAEAEAAITAEAPDAASGTDKTQECSLPSDLKADVKSVLLYMDQLLENLPEEKIMEFAKSEQFATYKKLFAELGLS